jgi:hypothetical protein
VSKVGSKEINNAGRNKNAASEGTASSSNADVRVRMFAACNPVPFCLQAMSAWNVYILSAHSVQLFLLATLVGEN